MSKFIFYLFKGFLYLLCFLFLFQEAEDFLSDNPSKQNQQKSLLLQLKNDLQKLMKCADAKDCIESPEDCLNITRPEISFGPNKEILCASSSIELKYDTQFGRHIVAMQDINPGTFLQNFTVLPSMNQ